MQLNMKEFANNARNYSRQNKLPIIFKQISDDLRAVKNVDVLLEDGTTTTVKIPTALIHEKYLQGLFIKNDAPSFVVRIMFKQDDDVCTIL